MFFDYPPDRETFDNILSAAAPKGLHFMNFEPKIYDEVSLLNTFVGMIKFAAHNNDGKIELVRFGSFLGKSDEVILSLLKLLEDKGHIKVTEMTESYCKINLLGTENISAVLNTEEYEQIFELSQECDMFRQSLLEDDLEQIVYGK